MKSGLLKTSVIILLIALGAFSRLIPHPSNFTAIGAAAIFAGMIISSVSLSLILPLASMWISDLILNNFVYSTPGFVWFTSGTIWIYIGILAHGLIAKLLKKPTVLNIGIASFTGALFFFLISNFGVWYQSGMYVHSMSGLLQCFAAALPFFGNFIAGNLIFSAALFSAYFAMEKRMPSIQTI